MKKTKVGQGRKLLLRGEAVATFSLGELRKVGGGEAPVSGAATYPEGICQSHPSFVAGQPVVK